MIQFRTLWLALLTALLFSSCFTASREVVQDQQYVDSAAIPKDQVIGVLVPQDPSYGNEHYPGSGMRLALRIQETLTGVAKEAVLIEAASANDALTQCAQRDILYLIQPSITHWEDRATNWSGLPDQIKLNLFLLESAEGATLNSLRFFASSSWWTFTNSPPYAMLDEAFADAVLQLVYGSK